MQSKKARRSALCGTSSTFLLEDEIGGVRSQPQQRGILLRALSQRYRFADADQNNNFQ
jgi:hypothetical protein